MWTKETGRSSDRLIHGEVVSVWLPSLKANTILIVDDGVAADTFNVRVIRSLAPAGVKVFVVTVDKAAERLVADGKPGENIIVLAKTPITIDVHLWELYWQLPECSYDVIAAPEGHRDPSYLAL